MASKKVALDFVLAAHDKFSAAFAAFNDRIEQASAAMSRMQARVQQVSQQSGLTTLARSAGNLTGAIADVGGAGIEAFDRLGGAIGRVSLLLGGAGGGLLAMASATATQAASVERLSQALGIAASDLQKLTYAASTVSVEDDSMHDMLATLTEKIVEADEGSEDLQAMFNALGVSVKNQNGQLKTSAQVIMEMADAFAKMEDGSVKTKLAIELFGDEGKLLIPLLNQGSEGIRQLGHEAQDLGLVFDQAAQEQGKAFTQSLQRVRAICMGLWQTIGQKLMPIVTPLLERLRAWLEVNRELIAGKIAAWAQAFADKIPAILDCAERWLTMGGELLGWLAKFADMIGGAETVMALMVAWMGAPLLSALAAAGKAFLALGATIMTTPVGWLLAGLTAVATLVYQIWKHWGDIKAAAHGVTAAQDKAEELGIDMENDIEALTDPENAAAISAAATGAQDPDAASSAPVPGLFGQPIPQQTMQDARGSVRPSVQRSEHVEKTEIVIRAEKGTEVVRMPQAESVSVDRSGMGFAAAMGG